ncbi:MAG: hypothetical protein IMX00_09610 [Limnochordales bacterium]|nr:hypothetical protein [Limnochordales bacterium]
MDRPGGSAVEGTTVLLRSPGLQRTATTGSDGHFQFTNLPIPTAGGPGIKTH